MRRASAGPARDRHGRSSRPERGRRRAERRAERQIRRERDNIGDRGPSGPPRGEAERRRYSNYRARSFKAREPRRGRQRVGDRVGAWRTRRGPSVGGAGLGRWRSPSWIAAQTMKPVRRRRRGRRTRLTTKRAWSCMHRPRRVEGGSRGVQRRGSTAPQPDEDHPRARRCPPGGAPTRREPTTATRSRSPRRALAAWREGVERGGRVRAREAPGLVARVVGPMALPSPHAPPGPTAGSIALSRREVARVTKLWTQTVVAPILSSALFMLVFGLSLGDRIREIDGFPYDDLHRARARGDGDGPGRLHQQARRACSRRASTATSTTCSRRPMAPWQVNLALYARRPRAARC